jgi:esterase/lipase superfamily enzyme
MGGAFNIRSRVHGYYDDNIFFNNPVDFIPGLTNHHIYNMGIVLGVGDQDFCRAANEELSAMLGAKGVNHWLDVRPGPHDWPVWRQMFPEYVGKMFA